MIPSDTPHARLLRHMLDAGLAAAAPEICLAPQIPDPPRGRTVVVGAGKAAGAMARAFETHWGGGPLEGLVVTRYGHACPTYSIRVVEAAHPVPDDAGRAAAARMLGMVSGLGADDLVVCLLSGGGSALLGLPAPGIALEAKQEITRALLRSGADIAEINCVRKHLSAIKGGRLAAAAAPARVVTLAISDVVGDDPATIASGPTVADPTTLAEARAILEKYHIPCPPAVRDHLADPASETPKPGDPRLARSEYHLVGSGAATLKAAAETAASAGYRVVDLGDGVDGFARAVGRAQGQMALEFLGRGEKVCILSGGETTVEVTGGGRGGRNGEFLLAFSLATSGQPGIWALACDTDGIDGTENNAGAWTGPEQWRRCEALGLDARAFLADNDAYGYFERVGGLVITGPTLTNVNDLRIVLVDPP